MIRSILEEGDAAKSSEARTGSAERKEQDSSDRTLIPREIADRPTDTTNEGSRIEESGGVNGSDSLGSEEASRTESGSRNEELADQDPAPAPDVQKNYEVGSKDASDPAEIVAGDNLQPTFPERKSDSGNSLTLTGFEPESTAETVRKTGLAWSAAIILFGSVVFMMILGWFVDLRFGTQPWGIVSGIVIGAIIGFIQFFRTTAQILNPPKSDVKKYSLFSEQNDSDSD